jgi:hypothetical protein
MGQRAEDRVGPASYLGVRLGRLGCLGSRSPRSAVLLRNSSGDIGVDGSWVEVGLWRRVLGRAYRQLPNRKRISCDDFPKSVHRKVNDLEASPAKKCITLVSLVRSRDGSKTQKPSQSRARDGRKWYGRLEEFQQCRLDRVINLFARRLGVHTSAGDAAMP